MVSFSGGKDSLASLLWSIEHFGKDKLSVVFCDTKWEHEITYEHIQDVMKKLDMPLITLKSKKYDGFVDLAIKKKRFPSTKARFCTEKLKAEPMIDYILDEVKDDMIIIQGIRKDESNARSKMDKQCTYFKYYFEPYRTNEMIVEQLSQKINLTEIQKAKLQKATDRLTKGKNDEVFHTYRKKDIIEFKKNYADDILRPIFDWTGAETINYILQKGFKPNPLYYKGASRVGCFPCIMSNKNDIKVLSKDEKYLNRLIDSEKKVGRTFFPPNHIPERFMSLTDSKSGKRIPAVMDVVKHFTKKDNQIGLFEKEEENKSCMSFYYICE